METDSKIKRIYTKRTKQQRLDLLKATLANLEAFNTKQQKRIEAVKSKIHDIEEMLIHERRADPSDTEHV